MLIFLVFSYMWMFVNTCKTKGRWGTLYPVSPTDKPWKPPPLPIWPTMTTQSVTTAPSTTRRSTTIPSTTPSRTTPTTTTTTTTTTRTTTTTTITTTTTPTTTTTTPTTTTPTTTTSAPTTTTTRRPLTTIDPTVVPPIEYESKYYFVFVKVKKKNGTGARLLPRVVIISAHLFKYYDSPINPMVTDINVTFRTDDGALGWWQPESFFSHAAYILLHGRPAKQKVKLNSIPIVTRTMRLNKARCVSLVADENLITVKFDVKLTTKDGWCHIEFLCIDRVKSHTDVHHAGMLLLCDGRLAGIRHDSMNTLDDDSVTFTNIPYYDYSITYRTGRFYTDYDVIPERLYPENIAATSIACHVTFLYFFIYFCYIKLH